MKNTNHTHTTDRITERVPVRELRNRTDALVRMVRVDLQACVNHTELMRWAEQCRRMGRELTATGSARAKLEDWDRRERALDHSASTLIRIETGEIRRRPVRPHLTVVR